MRNGKNARWGLRPDYSGIYSVYNRKLLESLRHLSDRTQFTFKKTSFAVVCGIGWRKAKVKAERPVKSLLLCPGEKLWWPRTSGSSGDRESGFCVLGRLGQWMWMGVETWGNGGWGGLGL